MIFCWPRLTGLYEDELQRFDPLGAATNVHIDVQCDHGQLVREPNGTSIVPLKNVTEAVSLRKPREAGIDGIRRGACAYWATERAPQ